MPFSILLPRRLALQLSTRFKAPYETAKSWLSYAKMEDGVLVILQTMDFCIVSPALFKCAAPFPIATAVVAAGKKQARSEPAFDEPASKQPARGASSSVQPSKHAKIPSVTDLNEPSLFIGPPATWVSNKVLSNALKGVSAKTLQRYILKQACPVIALRQHTPGGWR
jgi:hypothetical protein